MTVKPLNKTELAVAKAIAKLNKHDVLDKEQKHYVEAVLIVHLGRSNPHFDYDMFNVKMKVMEEV